MDYRNSLYMELPLKTILEASTHASTAVVLATISGGMCWLSPQKGLHGLGHLYNHPLQGGSAKLARKKCHLQNMYLATTLSGMVPIPGSTFNSWACGPFTGPGLQNHLKDVGFQKHIWERGRLAFPVLVHWTVVSCLNE